MNLTREELNSGAISLRNAISTYKGRVRSVESWRSTAAAALGRQRLATTYWEEVLQYGVALGLFTIDSSTYSYPVLKLVETPVEDEDEGPEEVIFFDDEEDLEEYQCTPEPTEHGRTIAPEPPENWEPPHFMECGHIDWHLSPDGTCHGCSSKLAPNWTYVRGSFLRPVPEGFRRTAAKIAMGGFPGLCCDPTTGLYIGGPLNDCRRTGDVRCEVHACPE